MKFRPLSAAVMACAFVLPGLAGASPITALGTFTPSQAIVDFETFAVGTLGPITVGEMTVSGSTPQRVQSQGFTQFPGIFEGQYFGFAGVDYTIDFSVDVSDVGFGLFDANLDTTNVQAFDRSGTLLETLFPTTGPTGGVWSTYVGFSRTQGDIARVVVDQSNDLIAVDNIAWRVATATLPPTAVIPLPAAGWLLIAGLAGLVGIGRRRRGGVPARRDAFGLT